MPGTWGGAGNPDHDEQLAQLLMSLPPEERARGVALAWQQGLVSGSQGQQGNGSDRLHVALLFRIILDVHDDMPLISHIPVVLVVGESAAQDKDEASLPRTSGQPTSQGGMQDQQTAGPGPEQLPRQAADAGPSPHSPALASTNYSGRFRSLRASLSAGRGSSRSNSILHTDPALPPSWPLVSALHLQQQYQLPPRARRGAARHSGEYSRSAVQDLELVTLPTRGHHQQQVSHILASQEQAGDTGGTDAEQRRGPTWTVYMGGLWYEAGPGAVQQRPAAPYTLPFQAVVLQPDLREVCLGVVVGGESAVDNPTAGRPSVAGDAGHPAGEPAGPSSGPRQPSNLPAGPSSPGGRASGGRLRRSRTLGTAALHSSSRGSRSSGDPHSTSSHPGAGQPAPLPPEPGPASLMPHAIPEEEAEGGSRVPQDNPHGHVAPRGASRL
jgi:hypothetical protein